MHKLCLLALTALAACAPGNSERITLDQVGAECDARALGSFVGQLPTKENGLKLMGFSRSRTLRWVPHGGMVTMDYNPQRLTVQLDEQGRIASAKPLEPHELPDREPRRPGLTKEGALVSDLLKLLLKIRAKEAGVAPRLIARADELEALAAGVRNGLSILSGWRFEEFGRDAVNLVEGRIGFAIEDGKLKLSRMVEEKVDA